MIRYFRQYDYCSCGPITLMNAHKWAGYLVSRDQLKNYQNRLNCTERGTAYACFNDNIKHTLRSRTDKHPTIAKISKELKKGKLVIINNGNSDESGHYFLITKREDDGLFRVVNLYQHKKIPVEISISRDTLRDLLRKRNKKYTGPDTFYKLLTNRYNPYPTAWYVSGPK